MHPPAGAHGASGHSTSHATTSHSPAAITRASGSSPSTAGAASSGGHVRSGSTSRHTGPTPTADVAPAAGTARRADAGSAPRLQGQGPGLNASTSFSPGGLLGPCMRPYCVSGVRHDILMHAGHIVPTAYTRRRAMQQSVACGMGHHVRTCHACATCS